MMEARQRQSPGNQQLVRLAKVSFIRPFKQIHRFPRFSTAVRPTRVMHASHEPLGEKDIPIESGASRERFDARLIAVSRSARSRRAEAEIASARKPATSRSLSRPSPGRTKNPNVRFLWLQAPGFDRTRQGYRIVPPTRSSSQGSISARSSNGSAPALSQRESR
jgi:hypothetical protein